MPGVFTAAQLGVTPAADRDGNSVDVAPDAFLFACLCSLPMGWLCSSFFCHSAATRILVLAALSFGLTSEAAAEQVQVVRHT